MPTKIEIVFWVGINSIYFKWNISAKQGLRLCKRELIKILCIFFHKFATEFNILRYYAMKTMETESVFLVPKD